MLIQICKRVPLCVCVYVCEIIVSVCIILKGRLLHCDAMRAGIDVYLSYTHEISFDCVKQTCNQ